jgi:hypothetical protein
MLRGAARRDSKTKEARDSLPQISNSLHLSTQAEDSHINSHESGGIELDFCLLFYAASLDEPPAHDARRCQEKPSASIVLTVFSAFPYTNFGGAQIHLFSDQEGATTLLSVASPSTLLSWSLGSAIHLDELQLYMLDGTHPINLPESLRPDSTVRDHTSCRPAVL